MLIPLASLYTDGEELKWEYHLLNRWTFTECLLCQKFYMPHIPKSRVLLQFPFTDKETEVKSV